jgi:hypothetical protein
MSKISLAPDASGTGIFTIASPNSNTNRTLTLPDDTGTIVTDSGNQAGSFTTLNTSGAVVFNDAGADVDFRVEGDTDANLLFVDASADKVGVGTSSPASKLHIQANANAISVDDGLSVRNSNSGSSAGARIALGNDVGTAPGLQLASSTNTTFGANALTVYQNLSAPVTFWTNNTERMRIDSSGNVRMGDNGSNPTDTDADNLIVANASGAAGIQITSSSSSVGMRIDSSGNLLVGKTTTDTTTTGVVFFEPGSATGGEVFFTNGRTDGGGSPFLINRQSSDGSLIIFRQANTTEGTISVSGSTVSYNGGHLSRWAQMLTKPDLLKGTVMSNLDEMNVYIAPTTYWTEEDELPVDEEGNPTVAVGDLKQETSVSENEQLNKVKVSDVEGDANVAGVFVNWTYDEAHQVDEINMAMTGDMIIRIAEGVTVARGDLLMSAGDGTAKPQGDDIVRSKTIAKVTSTHVTCTYEDGSYCVPCVLMAC